MIRTDNKDDLLFMQRLSDMKDRCTSRYTPQFTHFLDGRALRIAKQYFDSFKDDVIAVAFGGFDEAERRVVGIFPRDVYECVGSQDEGFYEMFELCALEISGSGFSSFTHRDVLGSVLALGIKRETLGDIFVEEGGNKAYMCLDRVACDYILSCLEYISRDKVKVSEISVMSLPKLKKKFAVLSGTVASQRLDCIVSLMTNLSREKSKLLISQALVSVNHFEETRCDAVLCEDDVISVRGYGRFVLKEFGGVTKKGRCRVVVHKMI